MEKVHPIESNNYFFVIINSSFKARSIRFCCVLYLVLWNTQKSPTLSWLGNF